MTEEKTETKEEVAKRRFKVLMIFLCSFVLLATTVALITYWGANQTVKEEIIPLEIEVCDNLDKIHENTIYLYPSILEIKAGIERAGERVTNMQGNNVKVYSFDEYGVSCIMPAKICNYEVSYCLDIEMLIPVNYTEWDIWYNELMDSSIDERSWIQDENQIGREK